MSRRYVPTGQPRHTQPPGPTGPRPETLALAAEARRLIDTAGLKQVQVADRLGVKPKRVERALRAAREMGGEMAKQVREPQVEAQEELRSPRRRVSRDWMGRAACKGLDLVLFFGREGERGPGKDRREARAKAVCAGCPVRTECLEYAISLPSRYGTWGGLGEDDRIKERRRRQRLPEQRAS